MFVRSHEALAELESQAVNVHPVILFGYMLTMSAVGRWQTFASHRAIHLQWQ